MPFTLAHPAAVLPLRRWCPRVLNFPALVAGSLSPDLGYVFERWGGGNFSHRFVGSFAFCLPAGLLMLMAYRGLNGGMDCARLSGGMAGWSVPGSTEGWRGGVMGLLPKGEQKPENPDRGRERERERERGSRGRGGLVVCMSLLIGAWTHLVWDSFTNQRGWAVIHLPWLDLPLGLVAGHQVRICHALWYASTFAGVAWLCRAYENWVQSPQSTVHGPQSRVHGPQSRVHGWRAVGWGLLVLPIGVVHHMVHGIVGGLLVAFLSGLFVLGAAIEETRRCATKGHKEHKGATNQSRNR